MIYLTTGFAIVALIFLGLALRIICQLLGAGAILFEYIAELKKQVSVRDEILAQHLQRQGGDDDGNDVDEPLAIDVECSCPNCRAQAWSVN